MICVQLAVLPHSSVAVYVRKILPPQLDPQELGSSSTSEGVTVTLPQVSLALPPAKSAGGTSARQVTATSAGHVIIGSVVST